MLTYSLINEAATLAIGNDLAKVTSPPLCIFLQGQLGAGKTTLTRGFLQGFNVQGPIKSPTFTLVESYELSRFKIFHFDLYRLDAPEELEYMGIRDYFAKDSVCLVEWPERGEGFLPVPDLICQLNLHSAGRLLYLTAKTEKGALILQHLSH